MTGLLMISIHLAALILWFQLPEHGRKKVSPFILPGFAGLVCLLIAEVNDDWIDVWELILYQLIATLVPSSVVIDIRISHAV